MTMGKDKLTERQRKILGVLKSRLDGRLMTHLNSCVRCGLCAETCHYYLSEKNDNYIPGKKVEIISAVYRKYCSLTGKIFSGFLGAGKIDEKAIQELKDLAFGSCSMCGRCVAHCSIGVDIPFLVRTARIMLNEIGEVPRGLRSTVDAAINTGNNMAIPRNDLVDTLKWLEEDLQMEVNDKNAQIPLDKENANLVYTLNPREPKFFPLSISAIAKIFYAAKEDWTICTSVLGFSFANSLK